MKFAADRPFSDPEKAAEKILEIANSVEAVHIEKINGPFIFQPWRQPGRIPSRPRPGLARGWLVMHESGTFVRFTPAGADLFA